MQFLHLADAAGQFHAFARCPSEPQRKHVRADGTEVGVFNEVLTLTLGHSRPDARVDCTACTGA